VKYLCVQNVKRLLDMLPTDDELNKVFKLYKKYCNAEVYEQQRINMFDFIKQHWND
jgi:hypothetical protein